MRSSSQRMVSVFFLALLPLMLAGCGGGGGDSDPDPQPINSAPTVDIVEPASNPHMLDLTTAEYAEITIQVDDEDGDPVRCVWTWDAGSVSPAESTLDAGKQATVRFTPPPYNGDCKLTVSVSDSEAGESRDFIVRVTGHSVDPGTQLRITGISANPEPVLPGATSTISATVDNPGGQTLTYSWKSKFGSLQGSGSSTTWTAPKTPGAYGVYVTVSDGTSEVTAGRAVMVSGPEGGLLGRYYKTFRDREIVAFGDLKLTRTDPTINFFWDKLSPDPSVLPSGDGWGARWTGFVRCIDPGAYTFRLWVDDGARMRIKNDAGEWIYVIPNTHDNWSDHTEGAWLPEVVVPIELQGGKWYPIEVDYFEGGGDAFIDLYWSVNGGAESIIPQQSLKPPA